MQLEAINDTFIYDILSSGLYEVHGGSLYTKLSPNGRSITNVWRRCGGKNTQGYMVLNTRRFGAQRCIFIHRIIYAHYNRWLDATKTIHHINHDRSDNRPENLQEVTLQENLSQKRTKVLKRA